MSRFDEKLLPHLTRAVGETLTYALSSMKRSIGATAFFEGNLLRDLQWLEHPIRCGPGAVSGSIGFGKHTLMDPSENVNLSGPFSLPEGLAEGIGPHRVYLYNPRTGQSTAGRAKLVRYLKQVDPGKYGEMPDNVDKKWFDGRKKGDHKFPPFVNVFPGVRMFLWELITSDGDPLMTMLADNVYEAVGRAWVSD